MLPSSGIRAAFVTVEVREAPWGGQFHTCLQHFRGNWIEIRLSGMRGEKPGSPVLVAVA